MLEVSESVGTDDCFVVNNVKIEDFFRKLIAEKEVAEI